MPTTPPTPSPAAPPAPLRSEGAPAFSSKMETFLLWLSGFHTYLTNLAPWVESTATEVNTSATAATAAANSAYQTAGAAAWVSGATYQAGVCAIDTTDWMTYRRKVTGAGTTRPGLDSTNWIVLSAVSDNSVTVAKLSADFILPVADGGTGASTVAAARTNLDVPTRTGTDASGTWGISVTGNSATATKLATARLIGGVSFDGTANINLPGVNAAGTQNTSGNAATATTLQTARLIGGVSFNGSADINLPGVNTTGNQNTTGNAATASTVAWTGVTGRPTAVSAFTNDAGYLTATSAPNTTNVLNATAGASAGGVGTYAFATTDANIGFGATRAGSSMTVVNVPLVNQGISGSLGGTLAGTWRCMGHQQAHYVADGVTHPFATLWLRIS